MKITHNNGTVTDTDKMNDCSAELLERTADFFEFCKSRKIPFILRFCDPNLKAPPGSIMSSGAVYWNSHTEIIALFQSIDAYFIENGGVHVINWEEIARQADQKKWENPDAPEST